MAGKTRQSKSITGKRKAPAKRSAGSKKATKKAATKKAATKKAATKKAATKKAATKKAATKKAATKKAATKKAATKKPRGAGAKLEKVRKARKRAVTEGIRTAKEYQDFFSRTARGDMRKRFDSILEGMRVQSASNYDKARKRNSADVTKQLANLQRPELLKMLPVKERPIFSNVPLRIIRGYLLQTAQAAWDWYSRRYEQGLERAARVVRLKLEGSPYASRTEVENDLLRLGRSLAGGVSEKQEPYASWTPDAVPGMIADFHAAKDFIERDAIAKLLSDETGMDLRSVYQMLKSPDMADFE